MTLQAKLDELFSLKLKIQSKEFQDYIVKPVFEELNRQKEAYNCQTLKELSYIKGKRDGLLFLINIFKGIDTDIKNTKYEIENQDSK
jgi:hypothetical protein